MHIYHNIYSIKIIGLLVQWPCLLLLWACSDAVRLLTPLSDYVVPVHYDLKLIFDIDPETNFSYFGVVSISMRITRSVNQIIVHSYGYQIDPDGITISGYEHTPMIVDTKYEVTSHQYTILLEDYLRPLETYTVIIAYSGNLDPSAKDGVVVGQYIQEVNYIREYFLTTLFKPSSAHKVFPCMDEPSFKASYQISLGHHKDFSAVSNMPRDIERSEQSNLMDVQIPWNIIMTKFNKLESSFVWTVFGTSRPMSSFLVGFVIARMLPVEAVHAEEHAMKYAVWTRPQHVTRVSKAVSVGPKLIRVLEQWYQLSFPLPKLDVVALPAGELEAQHWGLITVPEDQLLDKQSPSILDDVPFAKMLARHMAQQWFGDIVTLVHWSEMWFNDCLAALVAGQAVAGLRPDWGPLVDRDDTSDIMFVLEQDAMSTSTAVGKPIPEKIYMPLDEFNIAKGAFLIKMMNNVLGNDVFHEAIFSYMDRYIYSSATLDDFFSIVTQLSVKHKALPDELTVKQLMNTWIAQAGFPLLTVKRNYKDKTVNVSQVQYLSMGGVSATPTSWWVPLQLACEGDFELTPLQWLAPNEGVREPKQLNHCAAADQWLLLNVDIIAPCRINYDERNWKLISTVLHSSQHNQVSALTRVQLLADAFELAWNGLLHYSIPIKITTYLSQELQYQPMRIGLLSLSKIETFLKRNLEYGTFKHYVRGFISERYAAGGLARKEVVDGDDLDSVRMQTLMSEWGCRMNIPGCEENAVQLFQSWMDRDLPDENNPIPVVLRRTVYCTAVARGSLTHWQFVLARKKNTNDTTDGEALQYALSCSRDIWVLKKLLSWSISSLYQLGVMAPVAVFTHVLESPLGFYIGKDFFYENFDEIRKILSSTELGTVIKALLGQFGTSTDIDEFLQWREAQSRSLKEVVDVIDRELIVARGNVAWMQKNGDEVIKQMKETSLQVDDEDFLQFHLMASRTPSKENVLKSSVLLIILCVSINFIEF